MGSKPMESEEIWIPGERIRNLEGQPRSFSDGVCNFLEGRPRSFFHDHVRHLCLDLYGIEFLDGIVLLAPFRRKQRAPPSSRKTAVAPTVPRFDVFVFFAGLHNPASHPRQFEPYLAPVVKPRADAPFDPSFFRRNHSPGCLLPQCSAGL